MRRTGEQVRLHPATLYAFHRGSVLVPLPLLASLPLEADALGDRWARKEELHVTAVSTSALARRIAAARGIAQDEAMEVAWDAIAAVLPAAGAGEVRLHDELRVVRKGDERTLIAMATVEGLSELHERLGDALGLPPQPPPAHVTLYTRPGGQAIGLHTTEDLRRWTRPLGERPFAWPPG